MSARVGYVLLGFPLISETFIENEIRTLQEAGCEVIVASIHRPLPDRVAVTALPAARLTYRPSFARRTLATVRWFARKPVAMTTNLVVALRERSETMLRACADAGWIADLFRSAQVDQLHAHFATEPAAIAMATARLLGLPFTFTAHAMDLYVRTRGLPTKARSAARVVTVCEYNVARLLDACPDLPRDRIALVYCGVDTQQFTLRPEPEQTTETRLLSVGRLVPKKGFDDLIRAVGLLRDVGRSLRLDIIGDGREREHLEELIARLQLHDVVHLHGHQPNSRVREALVESDVFVLACVIDAGADRDSMPVVIKEAMAVGVPVIATDEVGNPEMVDDEVGRLVPPRDPEALAAAIDELQALDATERRALGMAARQRAVERFDLRSQTAHLIEVFAAARQEPELAS